MNTLAHPRNIAFISSFVLGAIGLAACSQTQLQQAQSVAAIACAGAAAGGAVIAVDGTILNDSAAQKAAITKGQNLVTVNCAAAQAAIAAVGTAAAAGPTALVAEENTQARNLKISPALLRKIIAANAK